MSLQKLTNIRRVGLENSPKFFKCVFIMNIYLYCKSLKKNYIGKFNLFDWNQLRIILQNLFASLAWRLR